MTVEEPSFTPELFAFLRELAANNDREWFSANKARFVAEVQEPALAFVEDVGMRLPEVSRHFVADARTSGGSLFRIYRDVRFSRDKSPYKTHVGIQFRHQQSRDVHAPGYYVHLEPGTVFIACGTWHPERDTLHAIRTAIASRPGRWQEIAEAPSFRSAFRLGGESLKRPPAGFDREHPLIEELKRKDFIAIADLSEADAVDGAFLDRFLELCETAGSFMRFLCDCTRVQY
ncbi:MAG TPA: DUF2461 domain-containing protein [Solirubrobacter sp.]|nr:DUF2461 domain-containing protein [Solirubrobacter sp.]